MSARHESRGLCAVVLMSMTTQGRPCQVAGGVERSQVAGPSTVLPHQRSEAPGTGAGGFGGSLARAPARQQWRVRRPAGGGCQTELRAAAASRSATARVARVARIATAVAVVMAAGLAAAGLTAAALFAAAGGATAGGLATTGRGGGAGRGGSGTGRSGTGRGGAGRGGAATAYVARIAAPAAMAPVMATLPAAAIAAAAAHVAATGRRGAAATAIATTEHAAQQLIRLGGSRDTHQTRRQQGGRNTALHRKLLVEPEHRETETETGGRTCRRNRRPRVALGKVRQAVTVAISDFQHHKVLNLGVLSSP